MSGYDTMNPPYLTPAVTPAAQDMRAQMSDPSGYMAAAQAATLMGQAMQVSTNNDAVENRRIRLQNQSMFPQLPGAYQPVGPEQVSDPIIAANIAQSNRELNASSPANPINQYIQQFQTAKANAQFPLANGQDADTRLAHTLAPYGSATSPAGLNPLNPVAQFLKLKGGDSAIGKPIDYSQFKPYIQEEVDKGGDVIRGMPRVNSLMYDPAYRQLAATNPQAAKELYIRTTGRDPEMDVQQKSANPQTQSFIDDSMKLAQSAIQTKFAKRDDQPTLPDGKPNPNFGLFMGIAPNTGLDGMTSKKWEVLSPDEQNALNLYHERLGIPDPLATIAKRSMGNLQQSQQGIADKFALAIANRGRQGNELLGPPAPPSLSENPAVQAARVAGDPSKVDATPNWMTGAVGKAEMNVVPAIWNASAGVDNVVNKVANTLGSGAIDIGHNIFDVMTGARDISNIGKLDRAYAAPNHLATIPGMSWHTNSSPVGLGNEMGDNSQTVPRTDGLLQALQTIPKFREIYHKNPDQAKAIMDQYAKQQAAQAAQGQ